MNSGLQPRQHSIGVNGIELCYFEWRPDLRDSGITLLFSHATGFHARCWDEIIDLLGDYHIVAVDQRGHGRSEETAIDHWRIFGDDLSELVRRLRLDNIVGIGHSMGGHAMVMAAAKNSSRFLGMMLIDPTIASPEAYAAVLSTGNPFDAELHPTAKRKNHFRSPDAMFQRFRDRHPYSLFTSTTLRNYCEYGLLRTGQGDAYRLACPPRLEASIYMTTRTNGAIYESVHELRLPVLVLRAREPEAETGDMDFASSPTWPGLVGEFANAREIHRPDLTHFMPMQVPEEIAALISREIKELKSP